MAELLKDIAPGPWSPNCNRAKQVQAMAKIICGLFAMISIVITLGIITTLIFETVEFFKEVSLWRFLTDTSWTPLLHLLHH